MQNKSAITQYFAHTGIDSPEPNQDTDQDQTNTTDSSDTSDEGFGIVTPSDHEREYSESSDSIHTKKATPSEEQLKSVKRVLFP